MRLVFLLRLRVFAIQSRTLVWKNLQALFIVCVLSDCWVSHRNATVSHDSGFVICAWRLIHFSSVHCNTWLNSDAHKQTLSLVYGSAGFFLSIDIIQWSNVLKLSRMPL